MNLIRFLFITKFLIDASNLFGQEDKSLNEKFKLASDIEKVTLFRKATDNDKSYLFLNFTNEINALTKSIKNNIVVSNQFQLANGVRITNEGLYVKAVPILLTVYCDGRGLDCYDSLLALSCIKRCFINMRNPAKALEFHRDVDKISKRIKDVDFWAVDPPMSRILLEMGLYHEAIKQIKKEYNSLTPKYKVPNITANYFNNLGVYYNKAKEPDSALVNFQKAKIIVDGFKKNEPTNVSHLFFDGLIDGNIAQSLMHQGKHSDAIQLLKKDVLFSNLFGNFGNSATSHNELATCYIKLNQDQLAKLHIDTALQIFKSLDNKMGMLADIKLSADLFFKIKDYASASKEYNNYIKLNDSVSSLEKELHLINEQVAYNVEQKELEIDRQQKLIETEHRLSVENRGERNVLIIGIIFLIMMMGINIYNNKKIKRKKQELSDKNVEILKQKTIIEESLAEKDVLIKEIHHRVKNNLQLISSMLSLQASKSENTELISTLATAKQRISSIAKIHEFLYRTDKMTLIAMKNYLTQLIDELGVLNNNEHSKIQIINEISDINLDLDTALPLGLIVNEIVTNSFKYAFTENVGSIMVSLTKHQNIITLIIQDSGKGYPKDLDERKEKSLGLELVDILTQQLNGISSCVNNEGSIFKLVFSLPQKV